MVITKREVEEEIKNFIKVWLTVFVSLYYCYVIGKTVPPKATKRLIFVIPIVCLFFYLPLSLSSPNFGGTSAFLIAWLANSKLLLFAFGQGPLCSDPSISVIHFLLVSCLPIKIQHHKHQNPSAKSPVKRLKEGPLNYAIKGLLLAALIKAYDYSDNIHPKFVFFLYCVHIYFCLELIFTISATIARALLGLELEPQFIEPQFNKPHLSTSLQDFWGRRWNLTVTNVLRPTVYDPTRKFMTRVLGQEWARLPAVFAAFLVSGLMHELMFYYLGRVTPTGEVTCFFLLHGVCLGVELVLKKRGFTGRCRLPWVISAFLTLGFVLATGLWLFVPQFSRHKIDVRAFEEYAAMGALLKQVTQRFVNIH